MSLQRRLTFLLAAFAGFALLASFGSVYAIQLHGEDARLSFQRSVGDVLRLEGLRLTVREHVVDLHEVVIGMRPADDSFAADAERLFTQLRQIGQYASNGSPSLDTTALLKLTDALDEAGERCLALVSESRLEQARTLLADRIKGELVTSLDRELRAIRDAADESSRRSVDSVVAGSTQMGILSVVILVLGAGLVTVGTALIRRWVILPIRVFEQATRELGEGRLEHRVQVDSSGEFGGLAAAMNSMAGSLAQAQANLRRSETKYRSLFENLRDAAVICDGAARVIACHDGDTRLLGEAARTGLGQPLLEVWPRWRVESLNWLSVVQSVATQGTRMRATDIQLPRSDDPESTAIVDLIAYPVEYGDSRYVALVLRDVTERHQFERQARRTEAMEATVTLARGVAHDFNNLLTSAIGTLTLLESQKLDEVTSGRLRRAMRACWQAAGLSRKLLDFAGGDQGTPQVVCLRETVDLILQSFDESFFEGVVLRVNGDQSARVKIDRDQLTQIVLNLVLNAREAMPAGGELEVSVEQARPGRPETAAGPPTHAVLSVRDTGGGITPAVKDRLFEPFFSTKAQASRRSRGMGLAVVYAAVKNADGFIEVDTAPGLGSTFRVYLPLEQLAASDDALPSALVSAPRSPGTVLLIDDEPMVLQVCSEALASWGYPVLTAESASEARRVLAAQARGSVSLAIVDMRLADGRGADLAVELGALEPQLRFIFTTGLADQAVPAELAHRVCARLSKPFHLDTLAAAVAGAAATGRLAR